MSARRVAVTGLGAVTALGPDVAALLDGLRAGRSGIGPLTVFDASGYRTQLAAEAPLPELSDARTQTRPDRFALSASKQAILQAELSPALLSRAALVVGTGTGGAALSESFLRARGRGEPAPAAMLVPHQPCSVTDLVARAHAISGPRSTIMTACSSSATALGYAADLIRLGRVDVALAGGAEGLCALTYAGFASLRATSPEPSQPFDVDRKGLNLGEGAAMLVLEDYAHAERRGAIILAELAGWGMSADAHHMTAPHPEGDGAARAMSAALADARLSASDIDYVNAHGTGTPHNDAAETLACKTVFGARATSVPISSIKSMVGHTLGAAGAIEAVASVLTLLHGFIPPTVNLRTPDPAFGLDYVPGQARALAVRALLSNSFAFGGNNTTLAFGRA